MLQAPFDSIFYFWILGHFILGMPLLVNWHYRSPYIAILDFRSLSLFDLKAIRMLAWNYVIEGCRYFDDKRISIQVPIDWFLHAEHVNLAAVPRFHAGGGQGWEWPALVDEINERVVFRPREVCLIALLVRLE